MYLLKEKFQKLVLSFLPILLVACGGGSDTSTSNGSTISGTAADGYLRGAIVCLDINENGLCDTTEPKATTAEGGVYNIEIPDGTDTNKPLVVDVPATAIDEDTNQAVGKAYVMKAPAGKHSFVSPTTTLVQQEIENNPSMSVDDAEAAVKSSMDMNGDDVSLFTDYVAAQTDTSKSDVQKAQYTQIHKIARVVAQAVSDNQASVNQAATEAGIDAQALVQELFALVMETIKGKLSDIALEVAADETATAKDLDVDKIQEDIVVTVDVDKDSIQNKLEEKKQELSKSISTLDDLVQAQPTFIGGDWNSDTDYSIDLEKIIFSQTDMTFKEYEYKDSSWQLSDNDSDLVFNTKTQEWVQTSTEGVFDLSSATDGRFLAQDSTTGAEYIFSVAQEDITDQSIAYYFTEFEGLLQDTGNQNTTFPQGSIGYSIDVIRVNEEVYINTYGGYTHNNQVVCSSFYNGETTTTITPSQLNNNCNAIYASGAALQTLDEMFMSADTVTDVKNDINIDRFNIDDTKSDARFYYDLIASDGNSGAIRYYLDRSGFNVDTGSYEYSYVLATEQGTWEKKSFGDEETIWITHPKVLNGNVIKLEEYDNYYSETFYAAPDGFVREGSYSPANHHFTPEGYGNKTAAQAVLSAFGIAIYPEE